MKLGNWIGNNIPKVTGIVAVIVILGIAGIVGCPNHPPASDGDAPATTEEPDKEPAVDKPEV